MPRRSSGLHIAGYRRVSKVKACGAVVDTFFPVPTSIRVRRRKIQPWGDTRIRRADPACVNILTLCAFIFCTQSYIEKRHLDVVSNWHVQMSSRTRGYALVCRVDALPKTSSGTGM